MQAKQVLGGGQETTTFLLLLVGLVWLFTTPNWSAVVATVKGLPQSQSVALLPTSTGKTRFTALGIIVVAFALWLGGTSANGDARHAINLFLVVLLASMILLNWNRIGPLFIAGGGNAHVQNP